jgi:NAD(P)-dependent dehydrogenase (short-subunit alcohol dehydrogenase family)
MQIQGAAALVTGASRGLGAALAGELARRGARVALVARGREELQRRVDEIRGEGFVAHGLPADVAAKEAVYPLVGAAAALLGPIDVLVHNASELGALPLRELADTECEDFARVLEANLLGPFRLTKAVLGSMVLRGRGLVIGISSDAALAGYPRWGAYGVSKAALDHLTRTWAAELGDGGVRFLSVDPGEMDTRMHRDAIPDADRVQLAQPANVARDIADLVARAESFPNGARLELASLRKAA